MSFTTRTQIRFGDVDSAGIVFYPRYFEMLNAAVEDWFAQRVGVPFASLHFERMLGIPTVKLETEFHRPGRLGELVDISIDVEAVGRSSCALAYRVGTPDETKVTARGTIVCVDLRTHRPVAWPDDIRARLAD